jgi:hypothetical protein
MVKMSNLVQNENLFFGITSLKKWLSKYFPKVTGNDRSKKILSRWGKTLRIPHSNCGATAGYLNMR